MRNLLGRLKKIENLLTPSDAPPYTIMISLKINGLIHGFTSNRRLKDYDRISVKDWTDHRTYKLSYAKKYNQNIELVKEELDAQESNIRSIGGFKAVSIS